MIVFLRGGLGNQIFQISMGLEAGNQDNKTVSFSDLLLEESLFSKNLRWENHAKKLGQQNVLIPRLFAPAVRLVLGAFLLLSRRLRIPIDFGPFLISVEAVTPKNLVGKWLVDAPGMQATTPEMVKDIQELFNETLHQLPEIRQKIGSLHIRLGDYLKLQHIYGPVNTGYIGIACGILESSLSAGEIDRIIIFSDQPELAQELLSEHLNEGLYSMASSYCETDFQELYLMRRSTILFIANSSFSWWAATLAKESSRIYTPWPILGPAQKLPQDFVSENWKRVRA